MRNVSHFYGSGSLRKQVLFDISCGILPGEIVIITGPSGSGKTTVLTLAGALRTVQEGSVRVLGQELNGASYDAMVRVRENIGFIFQAHNLLDSLSATQNVEIALGADGLSRHEIHSRSRSMLEMVGLGDRVHHFPNQLSGGQRQRVAVARAVVRHPKIILADEPTASLDKQSGRDVVELLRQLARRQGCAVLLVTHDNRILDIADRVMHLEDGRLESFGSVASPFAGHLLTVLSHVREKDHMRLLLERAGEGDFVELLNALGGEVEQFLNILNLGGHQSVRILFQDLLDVILGKIAENVGAEGAGLFNHHQGQLRVLIEPAPLPNLHVTSSVLDTGRIVNASGGDLGAGVRSVLCVPIRDRLDEIRGVVQLVNKKDGPSFTGADERTFRDFSVPLGMILEGWQRLTVES
jgi:putative ABC transport system ATP-binding protein